VPCSNPLKALSSVFWLNASWLYANPLQTLAEGFGLSTGHVVACNTSDEVETFVASHSTDAETRLVAVNGHFGKQSCNIVTVAFHKSDDGKVILVPDGVVRIIKVIVVGVETDDGWEMIDKPTAVCRRARKRDDGLNNKPPLAVKKAPATPGAETQSSSAKSSGWKRASVPFTTAPALWGVAKSRCNLR
jgi:hypothetical protein